MTYPDPKAVRSPKDRWTLIEVLYDGKQGGDSVAVGEWDHTRYLALRWNGAPFGDLGNPQSRGNPTWFMLPPRYNDAVLSMLPEDKQALARVLLGVKA